MHPNAAPGGLCSRPAGPGHTTTVRPSAPGHPRPYQRDRRHGRLTSARGRSYKACGWPRSASNDWARQRGRCYAEKNLPIERWGRGFRGSRWLSPGLGGAGAAREDSKRFPTRRERRRVGTMAEAPAEVSPAVLHNRLSLAAAAAVVCDCSLRL